MHYDELGSSYEPWQKLAKAFNRYKGTIINAQAIPTLPASGEEDRSEPVETPFEAPGRFGKIVIPKGVRYLDVMAASAYGGRKCLYGYDCK